MTLPGPQTESAIRSVGAAVLPRHEEIARAMVERIVSEVPTYRRAGREVLDDVLLLATATAEALAAALANGIPVAREDVPIVREHAARRVRQGIELDAFLHAYRAALFHFWDACAEAAEVLDLSRRESLALARFALDAIDTITTHAAEAYLREDSRLRTQTGRATRDLIDRLVLGQPILESRRREDAPGLRPTGTLLVVVGRVEESSAPIGDALQLARDAAEESLALGRTRPLVTVRQGEVVLLTSATTGQALAGLRIARRRALEEHGVDVRYGVSSAPAGFSAVPRAHKEATLALAYTSRPRPITFLEELSPLECVLSGVDATTRELLTTKADAVRKQNQQDRGATEATIRAFAAGDMNVARTAQLLFVHPNTVRQRLARIAGTTGMDPRGHAGLTDLLVLLDVLEPHPEAT